MSEKKRMPIKHEDTLIFFNEVQKNTLEHHGIKGQKWGVKHGPPYPLNKATSAQIQKSATSSKNGKVGMTEATAELISTLAVTTTMLAVSTIAKTIDTHRYTKKWSSHRNDNAENLKKARENEQIDPETGLYKKKKDKGIDDDLKKINPCFEDGEPFQTNCTMCTAAMEMRRRGYDVAASALVDTRGGLREKQYSKWFKPPTEHKNYNNLKQGEYTKMKKDVASQGDGARGEITVQWYMGGGHSMFYQVEKGKMVVYDGQSGKKYAGKELTDLLYNTGSAKIRRLDTLELNMEAINGKKNPPVC